MKCIALSLLAIALAGSAAAQQQASPSSQNGSVLSLGEGSNLPVERIGRDDLLGITVYDAPELSRNVRVDSEGAIRLPMVKQHINSAGLYPSDLETAIAAALIDEQVLVHPVVTVSVVEYRSRQVTVVGEVKSPTTFQATGRVTLLDAISRAGGINENAGAEILVSRQAPGADDKAPPLVQRIPVHALMTGGDPSLNIRLEGGEEIRIPEAGRVFVVGNVKRPGSFLITDGSESSVLKALALSEGLDSYTGHTAYIYRTEAGSGGKSEIPIELNKIMQRKAPDVALMANDILYVTNASKRRTTAKVVEMTLAISVGLASVLLLATH